ncbi:MAG: glycine oxidase ThiO [Pseudomonadota bacterium]|nr:glycine oxidase ThiO [Pseudomonadota bacterium]
MSARRADIVIVGGGVIGLSLAWRLAQAGTAPLVVDAGLPSATMAAAGMLAPSFEHAATPLAEPLYRFSVESLAAWRGFAAELEEESGETIDCQRSGVLGVALRPSDEAALRLSFAGLEARGAKVEWLSGEEARNLEPRLSESVRAGLFAPDDGQVDPRLTAKALRRAFTRRGGEILSARARSVSSGGGARVVLEDGEEISAGVAVLAAGALVSSVDLERTPPVFPVKGEMFALSAPDGPIRHVVRAPGAYLCPKADGRLVVGATEIPRDASLDPTPSGIAGLRGAAERAAPSLARLAETERWAGLRPATPDAAPILGWAAGRESGLVYALGHYRNGVLLAPATAALLAGLIVNGAETSELADFAPARFNH